jgi:hypothetical protein
MLRIKIRVKQKNSTKHNFIKRFFNTDQVRGHGADMYILDTPMSLDEIYIKLEQRSYDYFDSIIKQIFVSSCNVKHDNYNMFKSVCIFNAYKQAFDQIEYKYNSEAEMIHASRVIENKREQ